jgi:E3 Ubiquitin ligase
MLNPTRCVSRQEFAVHQSATLLASSTNTLFFSAVGVAFGLYLFFRGFALLQRKRLIQNTPTSKIRSASLGLVELTGLASGPYLMNAPLTSISCYCYRTVAWQEKQSGNNKEWTIVAEENLHVPFFLDDNTGRLLIDPRGAELDLHCDYKREFSDSMFSADDPVPAAVQTFLARHNVACDRKVRVEEYCIKPKNALYVLGTLAENPGVTVAPTPIRTNRANGLLNLTPSLSNSLSFTFNLSSGPMPTVPWENHATEGEVVNLSAAEPAPSSTADMTQQGKIAAALQRAGVSNPAAWSAAGVPYQPIAVHASQSDTSSKTAVLTPSAPATRAVSDFDLKPPTVLMKGKNNPAFFISWRNESQIISSFGWKSTVMIWGGPALTLFCLWILAAHLGWL